MATLFLALRDEVTLAADGAGHLLARGEAGAITLKRLTPGVREALQTAGLPRRSLRKASGTSMTRPAWARFTTTCDCSVSTAGYSGR
jgi:hypothetical protein